MDITKKKKLLKDNKDSEPQIKSLSELFRRYPIDHYFFRNYSNKNRFKSVALIFFVGLLGVIAAIIFAKLVFP